MRLRLQVLAVAGVALLLPVLVFGGAWLRQAAVPPPPLTRNLASLSAEIAPAFRKRVQAAFPIGSPAPALAEELRREGFAIARPADLPGHAAEALRKEGNGVCSFSFSITWDADLRGLLTHVDGDVFLACL